MSACAVGHEARGRHLDGCEGLDDGTCTGCVPVLAAPGLQVCAGHREGTWEALRTLDALWTAVEASQVLRAGQKSRGGSEPPLPVDEAAADWRWRLRTCLVGWCKVLEADFGLTLDGAEDTVRWMAAKVRYQTDRLLAHPEHADQLVADMLGWVEEDGTRHTGFAAEGRRLMFRGGSRPLTILCDCGDRVRVEPSGDEYMTCPTCGETGVWQWWRRRLAPETEERMTGAEVVAWLREAHRIVLTEETLRKWVQRGKLMPEREPGRASTYLPQAVALVAMSQREVTASRLA